MHEHGYHVGPDAHSRIARPSLDRWVYETEVDNGEGRAVAKGKGGVVV